MRDCTEVDSWTPYLVNTELERKQELRLDKKNIQSVCSIFPGETRGKQTLWISQG